MTVFLQEEVDLIFTTRPKLLAVSLTLLSRAQSEFLPCPLVFTSSPAASSEPSLATALSPNTEHQCFLSPQPGPERPGQPGELLLGYVRLFPPVLQDILPAETRKTALDLRKYLYFMQM